MREKDLDGFSGSEDIGAHVADESVRCHVQTRQFGICVYSGVVEQVVDLRVGADDRSDLGGEICD